MKTRSLWQGKVPPRVAAEVFVRYQSNSVDFGWIVQIRYDVEANLLTLYAVPTATHVIEYNGEGHHVIQLYRQVNIHEIMLFITGLIQ